MQDCMICTVCSLLHSVYSTHNEDAWSSPQYPSSPYWALQAGQGQVQHKAPLIIISLNTVLLPFDNDTVDGERFAGLNTHCFSPIKVFTEILSDCLSHKCSLFSIIKEMCLYSWKNFCCTSENHEKHESLAQWIFRIYSMSYTDNCTWSFYTQLLHHK